MERLQTDRVDVYLFHQFDEAAPLEQALEAMGAARESALAKTVGCSNFSAAQLRDALATGSRLGIPRLEVTEAICNLAARESERELLPLCRSEEIGFLAYSPLGAGFLTGKYNGARDQLPTGSRFHVIPGHMDVYFSEEQFRAVRQLQAAAERSRIPATQLAIAWVLAHPEVTTVLCGARDRPHIDNAMAAAQLDWQSDGLVEPALA